MAVEFNEGDIISMRLEFSDISGNKAYNLLHWRVGVVTPLGGGLFAGEDWAVIGPELAELAFNKFRTGWQAFASINVGMTGVTVQDIRPAPRSSAINYTAADSADGLVNDDALPLQDAPTLLKRTAFGERYGLGRVFVVGIPESSQAAGVLNEAAVNAINVWGTALGTPWTTQTEGYNITLNPVLFGEPPAPGQPNRVTQITQVRLADRIIKTQRRRRPGKGI